MLLLLAFAGALVFTSCEDTFTEKVEREYDLAGFTEVDLGAAFRIEITQGNSFRVEARGTVRDINDLELRVINGRLVGSYEPDRNNRKRTEIRIQMPTLTALSLHGASDTRLYGFEAENDSLELRVSGASELDALMTWKYLDLTISGASEVNLEGTTPTVVAEIDGASKFRGNNFRTDNFAIELSGVSKADVNVLTKLTGTISGNSELRYIGNPATLDVDVKDNSKLRKI